MVENFEKYILYGLFCTLNDFDSNSSQQKTNSVSHAVKFIQSLPKQKLVPKSFVDPGFPKWKAESKTLGKMMIKNFVNLNGIPT